MSTGRSTVSAAIKPILLFFKQTTKIIFRLEQWSNKTVEDAAYTATLVTFALNNKTVKKGTVTVCDCLVLVRYRNALPSLLTLFTNQTCLLQYIWLV